MENIKNKLTNEQINVVQQILAGKNVFMTGGGGVGKSYVIRMIYNLLKEQKKTVAVCAMTGCAAHILDIQGAKTLHAWSGKIGRAHV